jgi:hypothetical protein
MPSEIGSIFLERVLTKTFGYGIPFVIMEYCLNARKVWKVRDSFPEIVDVSIPTWGLRHDEESRRAMRALYKRLFWNQEGDW